VSDRSEPSLAKRWAWIQEQTTKFNTAYDNMKKRKAGGLGIADMMTQYLGQFKVANKQKNFNLVHCWRALKYCPEWHDLYVSYDAIDVDCEARSSPMMRPRGRTSSKAEAKREAS
jgi:hypothetical protein